MQVDLMPVERLVPYARNPRRNDGAVDAVAASIREFGFRVPVVVDEQLTVLAGHTRLKAARKLGLAQVPVHIAAGLSEAQKKAFRIADNRVGEIAEWDNDMLALELEDLRMAGTGHWGGGRDKTTVWNIKAREDGGHGHGTQKPVECMKRQIENNSSPGQAVYEPFSGSGTTIIAAEMTGRACHAIELSPQYVDVAVRRWQAFTGKTATLESTGEPFPG